MDKIQIRNKEELEKMFQEVTNSKEVKIAELKAKMQDLESRLAQISAMAVTTIPATSNVASNTDFESLHSFSLEATIPSPTSASLTIPIQEQLKKRDQTITELQEQLMQSSNDIRVGGPCIEHSQSGVSSY